MGIPAKQHCLQCVLATFAKRENQAPCPLPLISGRSLWKPMQAHTLLRVLGARSHRRFILF
jgi:hypothetical protein